LEYVVLDSLARYPAEPVVEALLPLLEGELDAVIKVEVLGTLARFEHPGLRRVVLDQLRSRDPAVREEAVRLAGAFLDARALPALVDLLRDPQSSIRGQAQKAIADIRYYEEQRRLLAGKGGKAGDPLQELVGLLKNDAPAVRLAAVQALARTRAPEALPALVRLRKDPDPTVREAVEKALDALTAEEKE
jgi:HEAT repeat protein